MRDESLTQILSESMQGVLESMCFIMVDGEADPTAEPPTPRLEVRLPFKGFRTGQFWLSLTSSVAEEIAVGFTGSPETLPEQKVGEVIGEITNMVCGATLSRYNLDALFDLGSPVTSWFASTGANEHIITPGPNRVDFQVGADIISAAIDMRDSA